MEKLVTPREFFNATYHHFLATASSELQLERWAAASCGAANADALQAKAQAEQELCVRAMAAVYTHHAGAPRVLLQRSTAAPLLLRCCHLMHPSEPSAARSAQAACSGPWHCELCVGTSVLVSLCW